jgi:hypothetical protein
MSGPGRSRAQTTCPRLPSTPPGAGSEGSSQRLRASGASRAGRPVELLPGHGCRAQSGLHYLPGDHRLGARTRAAGLSSKSHDVSARRAGTGKDHGAIFSSECSVGDAFPFDTCSRGGRSNQSGGGGSGAAVTAGARGVSESRVEPGDRDLPGGRASVVESSPRARCSARIRARPEPAKSTSG